MSSSKFWIALAVSLGLCGSAFAAGWLPLGFSIIPCTNALIFSTACNSQYIPVIMR